WIPVEEIRVLINGDLACTITSSGVSKTEAVAECPTGLISVASDPYGSDDVLRYDATLNLNLSNDAFVIVEAGGALPLGADLDDDGILDTWDADGDGDASNDTLGSMPEKNVDELINSVLPGVHPWAITNPIFIDIDDNGYQALGI
ncbi:MAG: hypothetical protein QGG84_08010, partial [Rhodospirillales bacterium]|nr:hypothetical protein [Rhodospirillales bacterium]